MTISFLTLCTEGQRAKREDRDLHQQIMNGAYQHLQSGPGDIVLPDEWDGPTVPVTRLGPLVDHLFEPEKRSDGLAPVQVRGTAISGTGAWSEIRGVIEWA